ncbi:hypothetical protein AMTRI_Chr10g430 [Amborella trichopoda]
MNLASIKTLTQHGRLKQAISFIIHMRHQGMFVPTDSFSLIFHSSATSKSLMEGKQLHAHFIVSGFEPDLYLSNHLMNMYSKCGCLDHIESVFREMGRKNLHSWNTMLACYSKLGFISDARNLFDKMPHRDSVSYNTMIACYDKYGPCENALEVFRAMKLSGSKVDHFTVSSVISACMNISFLCQGRQVHSDVIKIGIGLNVYVGSALVEFYGKCGDIDEARKVFESMPDREVFSWNTMLLGYVQSGRIEDGILFFEEIPCKNVVSWTTIISGCVRCGWRDKAIHFFSGLRLANLKPDLVGFVSIVNAFSALYCLEEGQKVHGLIIKAGFESNLVVGNALVDMYAKCGSLDCASRVFEIMPYMDEYSCSVLISEYAKYGLIDYARDFFESSKVKDISSWNALIAGYSELERDWEAIETFRAMRMEGVKADEFTYGSLIRGCYLYGLRYGMQLHSQTIKLGIDSSVYVGSSLIDMYTEFFYCQAGRMVFDAIYEKNLVSWNAMINGYAQNEMGLEALELFCQMRALRVEIDRVTLSSALNACTSSLALSMGNQINGVIHKAGYVHDVVVGTSLIDMYGKCRDMDHALCAFSTITQHSVFSWTALLGSYVKCGMWESANELFEKMPEKNIVSWNTMLSGHAQNGSGFEAIKLYSLMLKSGELPDGISLICLLAVCSNHMLEEQGKQVHSHAIKTGYYMNLSVKSVIINMYHKLWKPNKSVLQVSEQAAISCNMLNV